MSRLFLSHSSSNNAEAVALRDWLAQEGWDEVFLDLDPARGITAGERWERALNEAATRCEAVLFVISRAWLDSRWCLKEFNLARRLNKRLFGVLIEPIPLADLPEDLSGTWQVVDLAAGQDHAMFRVTLPRTHEETHVTFSREGLARLRGGLAKAGLEPRFFAWPPPGDPDRPPYRGLKPLEAEDAGIFFGRDAPIVEALDRLRGLREAAAPRLLVILGASGSGKSSFLRAGLLPRLARDDRNFLPLPVIRPERAAITGETGLVGALEAALAQHGLGEGRAAIRAAIGDGAGAVRALLSRLADKVFGLTLAAEGQAPRPAVVVSIDQAEELFLADGAAEGEALLRLVRDLANAGGPDIIVLFTIRSDAYDRLETARALEGLGQQTLPLLPMPRGAYQTVIEGPPARLAESGRRLTVEPRLTQRLLEDIERGGGSDALPLLAFTLEQLYLDYGRRSSRLMLADYEDFGGIAGAIEAAVERALKAADADPRIPREREARLTLLRRGLIPWLAGIDPETGSPRRRVARAADVPTEAASLIALLVEQRLLTTDRRESDGEVTIEPAHEALLRQWGLLKDWLEEDFAALTTLEAVKRAAADWSANAQAADWLNHAGGRLEDAERIAARPDLAADLSADAREYLRQCRAREEAARREKEAALAREEARLAEIAAAQAETAAAQSENAAAQARTARLQRVRTWAVAAIGVVVVIGFGAVGWQQMRLSDREAALDQQRKSNLVLQTSLDERQRTLAEDRVNLVAQFAEIEKSHGNSDSAIRLALHAARLNLALGSEAKRALIGGAELAALMSRLEWRLSLGGHTKGLEAAGFSPDGTRIVTASVDGTARVWDAATGAVIAVFKNHEGPIHAAAFSSDGKRVVTGSSDRTARIWNPITGEEITVLKGHDGAVHSVAFSPDGQRVVTASSDKTARIWDAINGRPLATLTGHEKLVWCAAFSPDGTKIVTASDDKTARIWNAATGKQIVILAGNDDAVTTAAFSPDQTRVVTGSLDRNIIIWDASTGKQVSVITGHQGWIKSAVFDRTGNYVLTASGDKTVRLWDIKSGNAVEILSGHESYVLDAQFSPDWMSAVTASSDLTARVWDLVDTKQVAVLRGHEGPVFFAAFSPDGSRVVSASQDKTARIWETATGRQLQVLRGHEGFVKNAAFSPDGTQVVTASYDTTARIWDAATGKSIRTLTGHDNWVHSARFSADGRRIVTASQDGTARIWDAASGALLATLRGHDDAVEYADFSPDGTRVVTASADQTARIWDIASQKEVQVLNAGTHAAVLAAQFSRDGAQVVTAGQDKTVRIWDAATGQLIQTSHGHKDLVWFADLSRDGRRLASASMDQTARVWDAATGREIVVLNGHEGPVRSAVFSPDEKYVVTASDDATVRIWDVTLATMPIGDLVAQACTRRMGGLSTLTRDEMRLIGEPDDKPPLDVCAGVG